MANFLYRIKAKHPVLILLVFVVAGCSSGVIVHDQTRAAELVVDFLSSLKSDPGIKLAYEWTDDEFKSRTSFTDFSRIVAALRDKNLGADIRLTGYEVFGPKESLIVYARSELSEGHLYFRFSLVGTRSKDYYLIDLDTRDTPFVKSGIHREYAQSIIIQGV